MSKVDDFYNQHSDIITSFANAINGLIINHNINTKNVSVEQLSMLSNDPLIVAAGKNASRGGFGTNASGLCVSASAVVGGSGIRQLNLWTGEYFDKNQFSQTGKLWAIKFGITVGASYGIVFGAFNKDPFWLLVKDGGTNVVVHPVSIAVLGGLQLFAIQRLADGSNLGFMVGPVAGLQFEFGCVGFAAKIEL